MPLYNKGTFDDRFYKVFNKKVTWIFLTTAYKKEAWLLSNFLSYWYEIVVLFYFWLFVWISIVLLNLISVENDLFRQVYFDRFSVFYIEPRYTILISIRQAKNSLIIWAKQAPFLLGVIKTIFSIENNITTGMVSTGAYIGASVRHSIMVSANDNH